MEELHIQAELHEILVSNLIKHGATSVKESALAADIKPIAKNIHPISNCAEIIAQRFVEREPGTMQIDMPKYEVRSVDGGRWEDVSEKIFMETLVDIFDQVSPIMIAILHGKEVSTPYGIFRLKNEPASGGRKFKGLRKL